VALSGRKSVLGFAVVLIVAAVLGWAWNDGGERPVSPQIAPATLPGVAQ